VRTLTNLELKSDLDRPAPGAAEIVLRGSVLAAGAAALHEGLQHAIEAGARVLLIDLRGVPQMSSAPISALVAASEQVRCLGGIVILAGLSPKLKVIFDALALGETFRLVASMDEGRPAAVERATAVARAPCLASRTGPHVPVLDAPVTIGSDAKCTIVLRHPSVEPKHAVVSLRGSQLLLRDLGSRHGTFVEGKRIREQVLTPGTTFTIASSAWTVKAP
jgi:anti-anti-sigma factor